MRRLIIALAALATLCASGAQAADGVLSGSKASLPPSDVALRGFDEFANATLKAWQVPGIAIAVVRDGKPILVKGYGVRDVATGAPMTGDTIFPIASMTKAFTATSVGMMVDDGKLSFDTPVRAYLPGFAMADPDATLGVTLTDIMSHRTGLPRHDRVWMHNTSLTRDELLKRLPYLEMTAPLRARFQYNNLMFVLSALAVEHAAAQPWEAFVTQRIFAPLGMARTTFSVERARADPDHESGTEISAGRQVEVPLYGATPLMAPAGGIYSTAQDMARWLSFLLADGRVDGRQIIQPATLKRLLSNQMTTGETPRYPERRPVGYGLGWFLNSYRGYEVFEHGGDVAGISTNIAILPQEGIGVVVLVNQGHSELRNDVTCVLLDRLLGLPPVDWTGRGLQRKRAAIATDVGGRASKAEGPIEGAGPSHPLSEFAGSYFDPGYGEVRIDLTRGDLIAAYNGDRSSLAHWRYDVFDADTRDVENLWKGLRLQFEMDNRGRVAAVSVPMEPEVRPIVFRRRPPASSYDADYLRQFVGTYAYAGDRITLGLSGNSLVYLRPGDHPVTLAPALDGEFTNPEDLQAAIRFQRDAAGRVTGFDVIESTGVFHAQRLD